MGPGRRRAGPCIRCCLWAELAEWPVLRVQILCSSLPSPWQKVMGSIFLVPVSYHQSGYQGQLFSFLNTSKSGTPSLLSHGWAGHPFRITHSLIHCGLESSRGSQTSKSMSGQTDSPKAGRHHPQSSHPQWLWPPWGGAGRRGR